MKKIQSKLINDFKSHVNDFLKPFEYSQHYSRHSRLSYIIEHDKLNETKR